MQREAIIRLEYRGDAIVLDFEIFKTRSRARHVYLLDCTLAFLPAVRLNGVLALIIGLKDVVKLS